MRKLSQQDSKIMAQFVDLAFDQALKLYNDGPLVWKEIFDYIPENTKDRMLYDLRCTCRDFLNGKVYDADQFIDSLTNHAW